MYHLKNHRIIQSDGVFIPQVVYPQLMVFDEYHRYVNLELNKK